MVQHDIKTAKKCGIKGHESVKIYIRTFSCGFRILSVLFCIIVYMVVCFVCFCLILYTMYSYCYVCFVLGILFQCAVLYIVCVYMCTVLLPPGVKPNSS
jgi:hypothetical protein